MSLLADHFTLSVSIGNRVSARLNDHRHSKIDLVLREQHGDNSSWDRAELLELGVTQCTPPETQLSEVLLPWFVFNRSKTLTWIVG